MGWVSINKSLPEYYECVFVELQTSRVVEVWRATDGDCNIWTKFGTDTVFYDEDIVRWKRRKLETKE